MSEFELSNFMKRNLSTLLTKVDISKKVAVPLM